MIRLTGVNFSYAPGRPVLNAADATFSPGLNLLIGPNGCGKSTLLKIAAGIERPEAGRAEIDGVDLWENEVAARSSLAYVPEQPDLTPYATVAEILTFVCRLRGEPRSAVREVLDRVGLAAFGQRSVRELSMGQRRRAVLAAAFLGKPANVVLDEPLEAMDRGSRDDILGWIDSLVARSATVIVVSHDLDPFAPRSARALTVDAGKCLSVDPLPSDSAVRQALLEQLARGAGL